MLQVPRIRLGACPLILLVRMELLVSFLYLIVLARAVDTFSLCMSLGFLSLALTMVSFLMYSYLPMILLLLIVVLLLVEMSSLFKIFMFCRVLVVSETRLKVLFRSIMHPVFVGRMNQT